MGKSKIKITNKTMKKGKFATYLLSFVFAGQLAAQSAEMDLTQCLNYGLEHSPYMTIANNEMELYKYNARESYSAYLPQINAQAGLDFNAKLPVTVIPAGGLSPVEIRMKMGSKHANSATVQLEQKIYDQTAIIGISGIKDLKVLHELTAEKQVDDFMYNTATAYYQVLVINQQIKLLEANEKQYSELMKILMLQLDKGVIKKVDLDRIKVAYNNITSQLTLVKTSRDVAVNNLKVTIGMPMDSELKISENQKLIEEMSLPAEAQIDISNRLDYKLQQQNMKLQQLNTRVMKYSFLPTLSGYARYGANSYNNDFQQSFKKFYDFASIGLKLNVPIFNGLKSNTAYNKQRIQLMNLEAQTKIMAESFKVDYLNSRTKMKEAYTSFQNNKENLNLAKEVHDITSLSYQKGAASLSDFLNADYSYKEAQNNYMTSMVNLLSSRLNFEKSKGNLSNYLNIKK